MKNSKRYMKSDADRDLVELNSTLDRIGHKYSMKITSRNGYHGLDLYTNGKCITTIATGTPRECIDAANCYLTGLYSY